MGYPLKQQGGDDGRDGAEEGRQEALISLKRVRVLERTDEEELKGVHAHQLLHMVVGRLPPGMAGGRALRPAGVATAIGGVVGGGRARFCFAR